MRYDVDLVKHAVETDLERLFAFWAEGRPAGWVPSPDMKTLVALGNWLREELVKLGANDADVRTQLWKYNRLSRTYDVWETAAECLNDVLDGKVEQNRRGHRRWG